ncbi:SAP30-binding protein isoform X2 [Salmo salar]|uniref:SAP30-binding protein isoform X2 n=1 Tax=Salmo salar TaxID=8030 RepID=A0ABM3DHN5_SALSA|nr:SAP30-binding protein-like isoform X2 [Salmo salar]
MASSKNSVLLSSLAEYGDDSEPDSNPETEETEIHGVGLVSAAYGEDDIGRFEDGDDKASGDEDSGESSRNSVGSLSLSNLVSLFHTAPCQRYFSVCFGSLRDVNPLHSCLCRKWSLTRGGDTDDYKEIPEAERRDPNELVALFSEKVRNMSPDKIRIPPEPPGRCSSHLQVKIQKLYEKNLHGDFDTNNHIQRKKEFRNPSIYEKLIQFCGIDELGTNYPKDMFDPHGWSEDSYYEALAKAQKVEMDKLEKAKKDRTKVRTTGVLVDLKRPPEIEFVTATKKGSNPTNAAVPTTNTAASTVTAQKRKSKWDSAVPVTLAQPALLTTTATLPAVVSVTTTASGTKTTVISAVGTILKKAK